MATDRTARDQESRESEKREEPWAPAAMLPTPAPQDGYTFRWVRSGFANSPDNINVSMRFREGWVPVRAEDHPELQVQSDRGSTFKGNIEIGGLLLCKMPTERALAAQRYNENLAMRQMEAMDGSYLREQDSRMPMLKPERRTRVSKNLKD